MSECTVFIIFTLRYFFNLCFDFFYVLLIPVIRRDFFIIFTPMYAQLGNIRFEGLNGFSSFEEQFGVNYAQHERINGKPRLEATGDSLDTITFDMYLHSTFSDPETAIETFRVAMKNRDVLKLILGNGKVVGDFVIPSLTKTTGFTDPNGNLIEVTLSVELLEFYTEDSLKEAKKQAVNSAFATTARNSNVRSVLPPKQSPGVMISSSVSEIALQSAIINNYTAAAESNPATFEYYSGKINESLDAIEDNISSVQQQLNEADNLLEFATSLPDALQDVNTKVQNMKAILPISDISDFKVFNSQLQGSVLGAKTANTGIVKQSIIRRI